MDRVGDPVNREARKPATFGTHDLAQDFRNRVASPELALALQTHVQKSGRKSRSGVRRLENIQWVAALGRKGLLFGEREKELMLATTAEGERVGIRLPGKESASSRKKPKPWDFRPKMVRPDGAYGDDLGFFDIWDALYNEIEARKVQLHVEARALATLFYRMAYMIDHERNEGPTVEIIAIDKGRPGERSREKLPPFWAYAPPRAPLDHLRGRLPRFGAGSLEVFLRYNDLLAWNEDCKYYYRDTEENGEAWQARGTGRINNLMTHVTVIGVILGDVSFAKTLGRASQQRGVAPATGPEALRICRPFLKKAESGEQ